MSLESKARGRRVRALREMQGFTQRGLAEACRCTVCTISQIENGYTEEITERVLMALAKTLSVPADHLLATGKKSGPVR